MPVTGHLFIWLRIDDQRQRSFVTGCWDRPPGSQEHKDIRGRMRADRRECMPGGGQTLLVAGVAGQPERDDRPGRRRPSRASSTPGQIPAGSVCTTPPITPACQGRRCSPALGRPARRRWAGVADGGDVPARAGTSPLLRLAPVGGCPWAGGRLGVCLLECRVLHADGRVLRQPGVPQALPGAGQELVQAARTGGRVDGPGVSA